MKTEKQKETNEKEVHLLEQKGTTKEGCRIHDILPSKSNIY